MNYSAWINTIADEMDVLQTILDPTLAAPSSDDNFNKILSACIDYAENRIQADLDLVATITLDNSGILTPNNRLFTLPTSVGTFLVVQEVQITVGSTIQPPLLPVSRDFLDSAWPGNVGTAPPSIPLYWCMRDDRHILVAPSPDLAYQVAIIGTQRIAQLSSTNTSNFLTLSMPQLYVAASMVFMTGYQRDFGAQASDPQMGLSWEGQYQALKTGLEVEEARKKWASQGWGARLPSPVATPPQT